MPKVKQVDFDLNAINTEITGEDTDLHREIMPNLIDSGYSDHTGLIRILEQSNGYKGPIDKVVHLYVKIYGKVKKYQWQYSRKIENKWINTSGSYYKNFASSLNENQYKYRCVITGEDGSVAITKPQYINII